LIELASAQRGANQLKRIGRDDRGVPDGAGVFARRRMTFGMLASPGFVAIDPPAATNRTHLPLLKEPADGRQAEGLCDAPHPAAGLDRIRAACAAEVWDGPMPPPYAILKEKAADCDGLVSLLTDRIDPALLDAAPRLKVVSNYAVGFNNVDVPAATARGVVVGNTPGVLTDATADMAFCLLIAAARRLMEGHDYSRSGAWKTWEPLGHLGQDLVGRTLGVIGMGRIGYALAKRCRAGWDMQVLYHDHYRNENAETELGARQVDLDVLLRESDFVSVHTDLNDKTRGLFMRSASGK